MSLPLKGAGSTGGGVLADIGTPASIGTVTQGLTQATVVLTTTDDVAAGDSIIVVTHANSVGTTLSSVTDSAGNTYDIDDSHLFVGGASLQLHVASCHDALALGSGGTITATYGASVSQKSLVACTVSGLATSNTVDQFGYSQEGSSTTWATGSTGTLSLGSGELAIAAALSGTTTASTPDGDFVDVIDYTTGSRRVAVAWDVVFGTNAVSATGTWGNASWIGMIVTYKGAT